MINIEGCKRVKNKNRSRFSFKNMFKCLEDPKYPSAGPFLKFMSLTGMWHPNMELKSRLKQVVYYVTSTFFFSCYIKCLVYLNLSALLWILQTMPFHMGNVKYICCKKDYSDWSKLIEYMSRTELLQLTNKNDEVINIMDNYIKRSRRVLYPFWIMAISCFIVFFTGQCFKNKFEENGTEVVYAHLFNFYLPFEQDSPPGYYYSMVLQAILGAVVCSYVTSWDSLVITMLIFFAGQLRISRVYCSKAIDPNSKTQSHENIMKCHQFHMSLIEHQQLFKQLISSVMFLYLIMVATNLGTIIAQIAQSVDDLPTLMAAVISLFGTFIQLLIFYWFSNEVTEESLSVSSGVFESEWVTMDIKIKKEVLLLQLATSKRLVFTAGPCTEMTLTTFISILKASYSFYTLLAETK